MGWRNFPPAGINDLLNPPPEVARLIPYMDAWQFIYEVLKEFAKAIPHQPPIHRRPVYGYIRAIASGEQVPIPLGHVGYDALNKQVLISTNKESGWRQQEMFIPVHVCIPLIVRLLSMVPFNIQQEIGGGIQSASGENISGTDATPTNQQLVVWLFSKVRYEAAKLGINIPELNGAYSTGSTLTDDIKILPHGVDFLLNNIPTIDFLQLVYEAVMEIIEAIPHHPPRAEFPLVTGGVRIKIMYTLEDKDTGALVYDSTEMPPLNMMYGKELKIYYVASDKEGVIQKDLLFSQTFNRSRAVLKAVETAPDGTPDPFIVEDREVTRSGIDETFHMKILRNSQPGWTEYEYDDEGNVTNTILHPQEFYFSCDFNMIPMGMVNYTIPGSILTPGTMRDVFYIPATLMNVGPNGMLHLSRECIIPGLSPDVEATVHEIMDPGYLNMNPKIGESAGRRAKFMVRLMNNGTDDVVIPPSVFYNGAPFTVNGLPARFDSTVGEVTLSAPSKSYTVSMVADDDPFYPGENDGSLSGKLEYVKMQYALSIKPEQTLLRWFDNIELAGENFSVSFLNHQLEPAQRRYLTARSRVKFASIAQEYLTDSTPVQMPHGELNLVNIYYDASRQAVTIENTDGGEVTLKTSACIWFMLSMILMVPLDIM